MPIRLRHTLTAYRARLTPHVASAMRPLRTALAISAVLESERDAGEAFSMVTGGFQSFDSKAPAGDAALFANSLSEATRHECSWRRAGASLFPESVTV